VDTVRSLLDGQVVLDRNLAQRDQYPPISVLDSLSRLMNSVVTSEHLAKANGLRQLMAAYARSEDLIRIGAYHSGADPLLDKAIEALPSIHSFLKQKPDDLCTLQGAIEKMLELQS
jgi:flagellum-specific ATP synthase